MKKSPPKVAIWMITYNHQFYLEEAILSVLKQKTQFPFHIFLGEDHSSDNTGSICKRLKEGYPDKISLFQHGQNIGAINNALIIFEACRDSGAKYIAMLEGDDYWTDENKLQKQFELLESRKDVAFCASEALMIDEKNTPIRDKVQLYNRTEFSIEDCIFPHNNVTTCTVMYRNLPGFDYSFIKRYNSIADWPLWITVLQKYGRNYLVIPEVMAAYRVHSGGIYSATSNGVKYKKGMHLLELFSTDFPVLQQTIKKSIGYHAGKLINSLQQEGKRFEMIRVYLKYRSYPEFNINLRDLIYKLRHLR